MNTSNDPISGNDKKGDTFWGQIYKDFNKNATTNSRRDINQLKVHWHRLKSAINDFNGFHSTVSKVRKSGCSDDQLIDEAQEMYTKKHGKPFALLHWWKKLKDAPKWCAYIAQSEKEKNSTAPIDLTNDKDEPRPIGREAAKAARRGKRKAEEVLDGVVLLGENINKIVEVQKERKQEREKVTEAQLEISRLNLKAAKEQKEAKLLEAYNSLLQQDTSEMSKEAKDRREKTLQKMEEKLFNIDD